MMKRSVLLIVAAALALPASLSANARTPEPRSSTPRIFHAKYHLSGYGVYHRTNYVEYHAAPCQPGGKGGGNDGTIRNDSTVRRETAAPETVTVQRFPGGQPFIAYQPGPGTVALGIVATATVTSKVTNSVESVTCNQDGSEDRLAVPALNKCGSHTYTRAYYAAVQWPHVASTAPGERIAVGVQPLGTTVERVANDWHGCYGAHYQFDENAAYVSSPLPFAHLPRKIRGKLTAIARGHEPSSTPPIRRTARAARSTSTTPTRRRTT
jgi:hypothetical protein